MGPVLVVTFKERKRLRCFLNVVHGYQRTEWTSCFHLRSVTDLSCPQDGSSVSPKFCGGAREATNCNAIWRVRVACCINKATLALTHAHAHAPGHPHARLHTHTHTEICNTCCFSAVTMVSRMRVIVTLHVQCVSCNLRYCKTSPGWIVNKCKVWKSFCFMITCCLFICLVVSRFCICCIIYRTLKNVGFFFIELWWGEKKPVWKCGL